MTRLRPNHVIAAGIALVILGLAERLGHFSFESAAAIVVGFGCIGAAGLGRAVRPATQDAVYPVMFSVLGVLAAVSTFIPGGVDPLFAAFSIAAVVAFQACSLVPRWRPFRLWSTALLLLMAHGTVIHRVPFPPGEDVYRFLNFGIDALVRGVNPYGHPIAADGFTFRLTYPPGALLVLAIFRLAFGDIRWGYIAAEAAVVGLIAAVLAQRSLHTTLIHSARPGSSRYESHARRPLLARWEEALILLPLALPQVNQAFFIYSNQEWVLLALAAAVLFTRSSWVWCGIALGIGIATKQYFVVFPVLFVAPVLPRRSLVLGALVALAICLPFVAWGPHDFVDKVFGNIGNAPDPDRITVWAILFNLGLHPARWLATVTFALGSLAALGLLWWSWRRRVGEALIACGIALAVFSLGASFSAYNYFVYALVFCMWGVLLPADWERRHNGSARRAAA